MSCSSRALAVDIHFCCICCCCCCCLFLCCCCLCLCCFDVVIVWFVKNNLFFYRFQDFMPKPLATADTKEIGKFIENPHVTRFVFPLTGMDESVPNFAFNFRFYPLIQTRRGRKWLFVGQLDDRFRPYLVDFLLHVRSKVRLKFDFFLATWIEKLAIDLSRGPHSAKAICVLEGITSLALMY